LRPFFAALLLASAFGFPAIVHADSVVTFSLENVTFDDGATGSGTVSIDTTTGTYTGFNFTFVDGAEQVLFQTLDFQDTFNGDTQTFFDSYTAAGDVLLFDLPGATLAGYTGSPMCTVSTACNGDYGYVALAGQGADVFDTGSLVPTPEPSGVALLGAGMLGILGVAGRRKVRR
jgi:hypothetical protein